MLGIGGVRALRKLNIEPTVWHMNEGHSAFLVLECIRELVSQGKSYEQAAEQVKQRSAANGVDRCCDLPQVKCWTVTYRELPANAYGICSEQHTIAAGKQINSVTDATRKSVSNDFFFIHST